MPKDIVLKDGGEVKLALCLFKYFPYGGLQRNFLAIAEELKKRGHTVTIYTRQWVGPRDNGLKIEILPASGFTNHAKNESFSESLQSALVKSPVDLVIGFNKMPGLDVYYCADTCFASKAYEEKSWLYRLTARSRRALKFERAVFSSLSSTHVLLLSAKEGEAYQKYYQTSADRLHLMPPGISSTRIRDEASDSRGQQRRQELGIDGECKVVAFVGSDYKRKGLDRIIKAVAALPQQADTQLLVIGQDKRAAHYEKLAADLGVGANVHFIGETDDVPDLLFAADCLAHPAYLENTGNVLLEGLVAGLPVICTEICGYAFYVKENLLGCVVPAPFDQKTMNRQLRELLESKVDWRSKCAQFARSADIYSRPIRAAERIELIGEMR